MLYFITILVLQPVGMYLARRLTDFENHKTFSQYESALIFKYLIFYFVNYYGIIIYVAVVNVWIQRKGVPLYGSQSLVTDCIDRNCMMELTMQMVGLNFLKF
jgi:anoctamin-7